MSTTHLRFVRALEAEYSLAVAAAAARGLDAEAAHAEAFDHVRLAGAGALAELRQARRYPWTADTGESS